MTDSLLAYYSAAEKLRVMAWMDLAEAVLTVPNPDHGRWFISPTAVRPDRDVYLGAVSAWVEAEGAYEDWQDAIREETT